MKHIAILGSTGSIGKSTLNIVESFPDRFSVVSMAAGNNVELAFEQARRWHPQVLSMATAEAAGQLADKLKKAGLGNAIDVVHGSAGTVKVSTHPDADFVVSAIVGVAGLEATYEAVKAGKSIGSPTRNAWSPPAISSPPKRAARASRCCPSTASTTRSINACAADAATKFSASG